MLLPDPSQGRIHLRYLIVPPELLQAPPWALAEHFADFLTVPAYDLIPD